MTQKKFTHSRWRTTPVDILTVEIPAGTNLTTGRFEIVAKQGQRWKAARPGITITKEQ